MGSGNFEMSAQLRKRQSSLAIVRCYLGRSAVWLTALTAIPALAWHDGRAESQTDTASPRCDGVSRPSQVRHMAPTSDWEL